jgi:aminopeptidase N
MRLLLMPEHLDLADRYFASTAAVLRYFGEWFGPYPYGYATIVDPAYQSLADGMEYPTFFTGRARWLAPAAVSVPESTTAHEAGHQFWYGIVATNEFEHAWMDEGITTFATARALEAAMPPFRLERRFFGGFIPWVIGDIEVSRATDGNRLTGYRDAAEAEVQATPTFRYWPGTHTTVSYNKTSLWLHTLERHLGWPVLQKILATYFGRWKFKHPRPDDFFQIVNEVSGQDLTWFFDQTYRSSNAFDYGVQELITEPVEEGRLKAAPTYRTTVVARRYGEATFPVDVVTAFADGHTITERWDGLDRRAMYLYTRPARATAVHVDPDRVLLLDVNYTNNSRTTTPRAREAGLKWSLAWMVWLQDLMLTYGFFV